MITPNTPSWLSFVIYSLATFRLSLMLAEDSGPFRFLTRFRSWLRREEKKSPALKKSDVAHGVECQRCNGIWFAALITVFIYNREKLVVEAQLIGDGSLVCFALSGFAILLNRMWPAK